MNAARHELTEYRRILMALLSALSEGAPSDALTLLGEKAAEACDAFSRALGMCGVREREALQADLADLRRFAALAYETAARKHAELGARLHDLRSARALLEHLDLRRPGGSCDVAG